MRQLLSIAFLLLLQALTAQTHYGTPGTDTPLPEILNGLRKAIDVEHLPKINHPIQIDKTYYWKHATAILSQESPVTIIEFGAYLYYNDQWNLRQKYPLKDLGRFFGLKNKTLLQAQPYVWTENWRTGDQLFGGWAMWYFIGLTPEGEKVCGYQTIHTTDQLLTSK